jgi:indole-3-glycerol phosphate synthase
MSVLEEIVKKKNERLSVTKSKTQLKELKTLIKDSDPPRNFTEAVKRGSDNIRFIAEIKKASPSKGVIRERFDHIEIATIYEKSRVNAISVITEEDFFQGSLAFLPEAKKTVTVPVLRKDFIIDEYQIYESRAYGADAILLIAAILDRNQASEYMHLSMESGMTVLFEIHDYEELEKALFINAPILGINNRDLKTLSTNLNTTFELKKEIPKNYIVVSESGINGRNDMVSLDKEGVDAVLVGTCLMESRDISEKINELRGMQ